MTPVIRIDDEVMNKLKKVAIELGLVFEPPNATLRRVLGLDSKPMPMPVIFENVIEMELNASSPKYRLIPLPKDKRSFFPGYKEKFELITDAGVFESHVTSAGGEPPKGDPNAGGHIRGGYGKWYKEHPEAKDGTKIRIEALVRGKRYKLSIV